MDTIVLFDLPVKITMPPEFSVRITLSVDETVQITGLSRSYLYKVIYSKELPSVRKGGRRMVPVESLLEWLAA